MFNQDTKTKTFKNHYYPNLLTTQVQQVKVALSHFFDIQYKEEKNPSEKFLYYIMSMDAGCK